MKKWVLVIFWIFLILALVFAWYYFFDKSVREDYSEREKQKIVNDEKRQVELNSIFSKYYLKFDKEQDKSIENATKIMENVIKESNSKDPKDWKTISWNLCKYSYEFYKVEWKTNPWVKLFTCSETGNWKKIEIVVEPSE